MLRKNQELEVLVTDTRYPNIGIVNTFDKEIRIKGAIKGSKLLVRISRKRKSYYEAKILDIIYEPEIVKNSKCRHFGICGGCSYQNLYYKDELLYKKEQFINLIKSSEINLKNIEIPDVIGSPQIVGYRNKMDFTFGDEYKDGPLALGMHKKGSFYEIENVLDCNIADEDFIVILKEVLNYFQDKEHKFYHKKLHIGFLRNLVVRKSYRTGQIMLNLVTTSQDEFAEDEFIEIVKKIKTKGKIVSVFRTINDGVADFIYPDKVIKLYGEDFIIEEICNLKFKISPFSFFQTNTLAAERLYEEVVDMIGFNNINNKVIFDLYSGTGTIAQILSKKAKKVIAVEIIDEAVDMAIENARINNIKNIKFIKGDVLKQVEKIKEEPDLIIVDPPRPGIEKKAISKIIEYNPKEFIYVSCNPSTLVRDLKVFELNGYFINDIRLLDQFPRTAHLEVIVKLSKNIKN